MFYKGSCVAVFDAYEDFLNYGSGVYSHITGEFLGKHAVKVVGYGTDNGIPYYLCAN